MRTVSQRSSRNLEPHLQSRPPEEAIPYLLKSLHHSLRQAVDEGLRQQKIEMSFAHLAMLFTLDAEPGLTGAELARRGFVTAQTMNTILRRMERDDQIERRPHPASPRADSWLLTSKGQAHLREGKTVGNAVWRRMLSTLKAGEVTQLQNLLQQCIRSLDVQNLEAAGKPAKSRARRTTVRSARRK